MGISVLARQPAFVNIEDFALVNAAPREHEPGALRSGRFLRASRNGAAQLGGELC